MDGPSPENPADVIARIAARRIAAGGDWIETMPDDAAGAIGWVISHRDVPPKVFAEDVIDCLRLIRWLHVTADHRELALLTLISSGKAARTWRDAARALGLNTRQAAQARYMRLQARRADLDEHTEAAMRRHLANVASKEEWLEARREEILRTAGQVVAAAPDGAPDLAEELEEGHPLDLMIYMREAVDAYSPGLCPAAEVLVAEFCMLPG